MNKKEITLLHYTTLENAKNILKEGKFKFSNYGSSNDLREKENKEKFFKNTNIYIASFMKRKNESIPMWFIYGKNKIGGNSRNIPVLMRFNFKKGYEEKDLFTKQTICQYVEYLKERKYNAYIKAYSNSPKRLCFLKDAVWNYESEFRFFDDKENVHQINFSALSSVIIVWSPFEEINEKSQADFKKIKKSKEFGVKFRKSNLSKKICFCKKK